LHDTHGVLAPNATLRARVVPQGPAVRSPAAGAAGEIFGDAQPVQARAQHIGWTRLLERVFDIDLRGCPGCSAGEPKTIAAILQRAAAAEDRESLDAALGYARNAEEGELAGARLALSMLLKRIVLDPLTLKGHLDFRTGAAVGTDGTTEKNLASRRGFEPL